MTRLSVNINKLATLRNARGGNNPDVVKMALACESYGAQGITVHPRPDERHIRFADVVALAPVLTTEFNIEGYPDPRYFELITIAKPAQATLVPDPPSVLTSNAGWDTVKHKDFLTDIVAELHALGTRVSVFVGTNLAHIEGAAAIGADRIELYTEPYAANYFVNRAEAIAPFKLAANRAYELGLGINAGHDLDLDNLAYLKQEITHLQEVSIGHALITDALTWGLQNAIGMYLRQLNIGN